MDALAGLTETSIAEVVMPTFKIFMPLQKARKDEIFAKPPTEHSYGPHERQKLDLYLPAQASEPHAKLPVILFAYGGGLVQGDKRMAPADGTVYPNVGKYFSDRGFIAVLPDYRLVGRHSAAYPSGGEDIGLAVDWVVKNVNQVNKDAIFLIGNSAGGVHVSSYLWSNDLPSTVSRIPIRAAILAQVPMHFRAASEGRQKDLDTYFKGDQEGRCPFGLRQKSKDTTECLLVLAEKEPEDEILAPNRDFLGLFPLNGMEKPDVLNVALHNHISPFLAFGLGGKADEWGNDLMKWIEARV